MYLCYNAFPMDMLCSSNAVQMQGTQGAGVNTIAYSILKVL